MRKAVVNPVPTPIKIQGKIRICIVSLGAKASLLDFAFSAVVNLLMGA